MIHSIIEELNENNSTNYKLQTLKKYKDNELLKRVLKMTYDKVQFTYGITMKNVQYTPEIKCYGDVSLSDVLDILENDFSTRKVTGNAALEYLSSTLETLSGKDAKLIEKILDRDLKINVGKTQINKVWKGLLVKPAYCRCSTYSDKTAKKINYPAFIQLKADGSYREFQKSNGVECQSRSGISYEYPALHESINLFPEGKYTGELTVLCDDYILELLKKELNKLIKQKKDFGAVTDAIFQYEAHKKENKKYILPRTIGNGFLNSDDVPHNNIILELWDFISIDEYNQAIKKDRKNPCTVPYYERFNALKDIISECNNPNIRLIETKIVKNIREALLFASDKMSLGFEGAVLKDFEMVFKDGTSPQQLKLKLCIDCEMRILGFNDGTKGTKRDGKVGSVIFGNDEGTIKGNVSGFSDDILDDMTTNPDKYLDRIFTCQFNDLTKARGHDYFALSHPRWVELRNDKDETDTLKKVLELREMALQIKTDTEVLENYKTKHPETFI